MARTHGEQSQELVKTSEATVDEQIARLANYELKDVVLISEGRSTIGFPNGSGVNASMFLVARLFTDAIFNQDIRAIQLIINRIDGGLPKDTELDDYQTQFGDCLSEVMSMPNKSYTMVKPDDTVMMALCKSLFDLATEDIYYDPRVGNKKPSSEAKKDRDAAMRMVLERTGGRKTLVTKASEVEQIETAPWILKLQEKTC